jgi:hypothetical protein
MIIDIKKIEELMKDESHNIWEKYNKKRLYLDFIKIVNLEIHKYNTGNISNALLDGETISNSKARKYIQGEAYIDLNTNVLECQYMHTEIINRLKNLLCAS